MRRDYFRSEHREVARGSAEELEPRYRLNLEPEALSSILARDRVCWKYESKVPLISLTIDWIRFT
jgi:hypothetical protein